MTKKDDQRRRLKRRPKKATNRRLKEATNRRLKETTNRGLKEMTNRRLKETTEGHIFLNIGGRALRGPRRTSIIYWSGSGSTHHF